MIPQLWSEIGPGVFGVGFMLVVFLVGWVVNKSVDWFYDGEWHE